MTGTRGTCTRQWGFNTLPRYLLWKVNRFYVDEKWTPQKRDVEVDMPLELDVANLMSKGACVALLLRAHVGALLSCALLSCGVEHHHAQQQ